MSLKKQIVLIFLIIIFSITSIDILANKYLLDDYYLKIKQDSILSTVKNIENNLKDIKDIDFLNELEKKCNVQNLSLLVIDNKGEPSLYFYNKENENSILKRLEIYISENNSEKKYSIRQVEDNLLDINYLEICGQLSNGYYYIIKTPIDSISESVSISTLFLLYILVILLPLSIMLILFIAERITSPLSKLINLSKEISNLNFSTKYIPEGTTEIIELGKNFNKMSNQLEKNIGELKTANIKLRNNLEKKEKNEEMRRDFISSVSHELKTPIAIISGYSESLKDGINDPEDLQFYAETIYDETQKLSKMVKEILSINKIEYIDNKVDIEKINLYSLISNIILPMEKVFEEKKINLTINISDTISIWTDAYLFSQIISNYITNAIDHTKENKNIIIYYKDSKVFVYNDGDNIESENIEHIWEKFYKIDKSRNRNFGGTGLGLSIVKAFANSLNQECGVINKKNGVEFFISTQ